jgi:iron complex outermembrane recepter protein
MRSTIKPAMLAATAASMVIGAAAPAFAADEGSQLEEIIVTAERREENIQTMPLSVVALGGNELVAEGKTRLEDALASVPGVHIQDNTLTGGAPFIRGVGPALGTDPSAAVSLDGVYQSEGLFGSQFDVARVEVLRGPQGTLYGRNATAGSVNIITNSPTNKFEGSGSLQLGNYNSTRVEGMLNIPLSDNLAIRAAVLDSRHDGYMSNGTQDEDIKAGRVKVKYTPTDALTLSLGADYVKLGGHGNGSTQAPLDSNDPWKTTQLQGKQQSSRKSVYGQLDWDVGIGTLTYIPAAYEVQVYGDFQLLGADPAPAGMGLIVSWQRNRQQTHELRLASPVGQGLQWLAGAYYLDNKGTPNPVAGRLAEGAHENPSDNAIATESKSKALFGQLTIPVIDQLRLIAGARYTWDEKSAYTIYYAPLVPAPPGPSSSYPGAPVIGTSSTTSLKTNKFTYKAGVEYDIAKDHLLYATYSTGFKAGGVNDPVANTTYKPEELNSIELGSKNRFMDNRAQLNVSAFHYDYKNYQVFTVALTSSPPQVSVLNAAAATLYGVEAEGSFQITSGDRVNASVAYNHTRFDTFIYCSNAYPCPPGIDRSNTQLPQAPEWTEVVGYDHDFVFGGGNTFSIGAEARFYSQFDTSIEPARDSHQPAYQMYDAHASYQPQGTNWSLNAYINNATNEAVRQFTRELVIGPFDIHQLSIGAPRTYGAGISAKF